MSYETNTIIDVAFVRHWASRYPSSYDVAHYDPHLLKAREGDPDALRRLTEWKNVGNGPRPMPLAPTKEKAFRMVLANFPKYKAPGGRKLLRQCFRATAPVYSIFWYHVLFGSPIFDVHTNRAFHCFTRSVLLEGRKARLPYGGGHWQLYFRYYRWFKCTLRELQRTDQSITHRSLDRALLMWGRHNR